MACWAAIIVLRITVFILLPCMDRTLTDQVKYNNKNPFKPADPENRPISFVKTKVADLVNMGYSDSNKGPLWGIVNRR